MSLPDFPYFMLTLVDHHDIMVGRVPLYIEGEEKEIPAFVEEVSCSLKGVYDDILQRLNESHHINKVKYNNFSVGDRV